ncbi:LETM1-domain-containing protein [Suhomyces tanzawaensis NRRL Y-17324]|uniref:LETM1-domain-containing protein n=1 Tax=Suhomyces tanzawaensis NRRL Y-17324 TaxID=984487 RepID=A0A1E4SDL8_9ASCO|nr:LETM1-domain-containing protein [Suhomyces tanzawaensis NRRL Y-17324]ODV77610.1 LETM1-domain-containing protein [Suhomyces tanzawaensis NRRL Y-17324]
MFVRLQSTNEKKEVEKTEKKLNDLDKNVASAAKNKDLVKADKKASLWDKIKHEAQHYWDGTKLLGFEMKVSTKLLFKLVSGYGLSRRESNQLQRTIVDVIRLVPFSMFVLIPFAELLLPIALKLFPNLLPSTYESKQDRVKKRAKLSKTRVSASEYIKKTMEESGLKLSKKITEAEKEAFVSFFHTISMGKNPTREHLIQVARMFKNDQVLDNLSRPQLVAMTKYMSLRPFGTDSILRYQIRHRLLNIIKDDKAIDYEGVDSLSVPELHIACSQRGIKTTDVSPGRLREDLSTWLDLRLRQKIPSTLLILSSTYTYGDNSHSIETYYDALLAVLSSIPDEVYNVAKLELSDDSKLKLNMLKEQDEMINEENLREKDTVNQVKDNINLDEYEDAAGEGMKVEHEDAHAEEKSTKKHQDAKEESKA